MTARPPSDTGGAPAAINAFLRGVERRGAVFAELQCGDAGAGDAALAAAMRAFHAGAARVPMGEWPRRYWSLLLATPMLRRVQPLPARADALAPLGQVGHGPRAALLLRLAAGLSEAEAAAALGIAPATYRLALQQALPRRGDGSADAEAWRSLAAAVQEAVRVLPPQRLAHLARLREDAVQPSQRDAVRAARPAAPVFAIPATPPRRGLRAALWTGLGLCVAGLAFSFLWPRPPQSPSAPGAGPDIRKAALPAAAAPASRFDEHTALLSDRDFDLLLDADDERVYRDLAFHAWYAAQPVQPALSPPAPDATAPAAEPVPEDAAPETSDVTL